VQNINGVIFELVGCLAEFPSEEFDEIAVHFFGSRTYTSSSGSESYWRLLDSMERSGARFERCDAALVERLELQAVERANAYEDVVSAVSELREMGLMLAIASSLSAKAVTRFLEKFSFRDFFTAVWNRDNAGGPKAAPLKAAIQRAHMKPEQVMFLTDSAEGLNIAKSSGVNGILMMNDPDEAMRLASLGPSGGIVSLHELPDFIRVVAAENALK
jgi:phosphoglycolate phosphatase-like HAD superfamily hydrolase